MFPWWFSISSWQWRLAIAGTSCHDCVLCRSQGRWEGVCSTVFIHILLMWLISGSVEAAKPATALPLTWGSCSVVRSHQQGLGVGDRWHYILRKWMCRVLARKNSQSFSRFSVSSVFSMLSLSPSHCVLQTDLHPLVLATRVLGLWVFATTLGCIVLS